ncbi:helix-turn-helix transcriptional regulator [Allonocardiopsis opalescens]|uniref:Regulatory LuxR family protein n=1 Tax=Allonocardiopsis opalescens TaxID=1144618 RepID=A0A2T0Q1N4_9ACTN|nr:helix-turn-helix transcriptional regulator [Allonocardiopsis opalescens]PRX97681.1 regulatory LuxR family protein [Allonocardiopsis opalescens]
MRLHIDREAAGPVIGLVTAALLGAVIGIIAIRPAAPAIAAMTLAQLAVTALGARAPRAPVLWAGAIAVVMLGSTLLDARIAELVHSGAVPWLALAVAMGALNLYRHATDWLAITAGSAALALGSAGVVAVGVRAGVPVATTILAASVPFLAGVIFALMFQLRDARDDRVRRPELSVEVADAPDAAGTLDAARRALALVALRTDELVASTGDTSARRAAADLRDIARRALTGESAGRHSVARIELHTPAAQPAAAPPAPPMPELPDREREILRLVATGASNAAIGRSLYLSEATVKQYVSRLMRRFDRENRTQLALMAARWFDGP